MISSCSFRHEPAPRLWPSLVCFAEALFLLTLLFPSTGRILLNLQQKDLQKLHWTRLTSHVIMFKCARVHLHLRECAYSSPLPVSIKKKEKKKSSTLLCYFLFFSSLHHHIIPQLLLSFHFCMKSSQHWNLQVLPLQTRVLSQSNRNGFWDRVQEGKWGSRGCDKENRMKTVRPYLYRVIIVRGEGSITIFFFF